MRLPRTRLLRALLLALLQASGCAMPVAFGRSGQVLEPGAFRVGAGSTGGLAPTRVDIRPASFSNEAPRGFRGYSPASVHVASDELTVIFGPVVSPEATVAFSPWGRCELGSLVSLSRLGGEVRCGSSPGELGGLEVALSLGLARPFYPRPVRPEYRAGIDLSLAGEGPRPLLNLYYGRIPWTRGVVHEPGMTLESEERIEHRLSMPIGVLFPGSGKVGDSKRTSAALALVPEVTFASRTLDPLPADGPQVRFRHFFALYFTVRAELVFLP